MNTSNKQIKRNNLTNHQLLELSIKIKKEGIRLGFQQIGITDTNLSEDEKSLQDWQSIGRNQQIEYIYRNAKKRSKKKM